MVDAGGNAVDVPKAGQVVATLVQHAKPLNESILEPCQHGKQWTASIDTSGRASFAGISACKSGTYVLSFQHVFADTTRAKSGVFGGISDIFSVSTTADQIRVEVQPEGAC